jgi:hypothetical protein
MHYEKHDDLVNYKQTEENYCLDGSIQSENSIVDFDCDINEAKDVINGGYDTVSLKFESEADFNNKKKISDIFESEKYLKPKLNHNKIDITNTVGNKPENENTKNCFYSNKQSILNKKSLHHKISFDEEFKPRNIRTADLITKYKILPTDDEDVHVELQGYSEHITDYKSSFVLEEENKTNRKRSTEDDNVEYFQGLVIIR